MKSSMNCVTGWCPGALPWHFPERFLGTSPAPNFDGPSGQKDGLGLPSTSPGKDQLGLKISLTLVPKM
jgi:hypothetical protein